MKGTEVSIITKTIIPEIIGIMKEAGLSNFHNVGRRILRAKDMETAAISGLRLIGFEKASSDVARKLRFYNADNYFESFYDEEDSRNKWVNSS